jgi:hypothetical protein
MGTARDFNRANLGVLKVNLILNVLKFRHDSCTILTEIDFKPQIMARKFGFWLLQSIFDKT